jgi:hypothetical protein
MASDRSPTVQIHREFISMTSWAAKGEDAPGMMQGTAEVPHPSADVHLPEAAAVCDAATALDRARDMAAPQPTLVDLLGSHVRLTREFLPQIGINSIVAIHESQESWERFRDDVLMPRLQVAYLLAADKYHKLARPIF